MPWVEKRASGYLVGWREGGRKVRRSLKGLETERGPVRGRSPVLGAYLAHMLDAADDLKESTRYQYTHAASRHILPTLGARPLAEVTSDDLRALLGELRRRGLGGSARTQVRRILSRLYRQAVAEGLVLRNPVQTVPEPRAQPRDDAPLLTPEDVEALADAISPRYRALILLAGYTGLRVGELGALSLPRLDLLRREARVQVAVATAGGRHWIAEPKTRASRRSVPIPPSVCEETACHLERFPPATDGRVFTMPGSGLLHHGSIAKPFARARRAVGPPGATFHGLRHHFAALLISQGAHPKLLQTLLGHASISTTLDRYGHLYPALGEELAERVETARRLALSSKEPVRLLRGGARRGAASELGGRGAQGAE